VKAALRFIPIALVTAALAIGQDSIGFERKWKVGDSERQSIGLAFSTQMGDVAISMTAERKVAKTFEAGDAELQVTVSDLKVMFNGSEMPPRGAPTQPVTMRLDKRGMPLGQSEQQGRGLGVEFLAYAYLVPGEPVKVGEVAGISYTRQGNPSTKAKGTLKCESLTEGVAKLIGKYDLWTENTGDDPIKVAITSWFRVADAKFIKAEGTFSNWRLQSGMDPTVAQFTMELIEK
jgi:hypothetical protein